MSNREKGMDDRHGADLFHANHKEMHGKPGAAHGVAANHRKPLRQSNWAKSDPQEPGQNIDLIEDAREGVPTVPSQEALSAPAPPGRSVLSPEHYREPTVAPGTSLFAAEHARPKRKIRHHQSPENTAKHVELRHHDRNEDGSDPLHAKVRSGKKPPAALASELKAYEAKGGKS